MDCGKHKHQGYRGVCASCLRERLSLLPNTTPYYTINLSNSSTTTTTVSSSSPVKKYHRRSGSMTMTFAVREALSGKLVGGLGGGLKKSKSMAHVPRDDSFVVSDCSRRKKTTTEKVKSTTAKVSGFWRKLFGWKGKGGGSDVGGGLVASRQRVY
ncbi:unnamed protein product [Eruca vesicaria subsp. sativa]|uniref:Uncharacterized protein n=1 Tax=Eruca vesicaria subsp. sativa TaxID=29727 RepID=A0ABC8JB43_ERUVS|nr:unnamed protein product [Eruca vesicaria subsp. sativa]